MVNAYNLNEWAGIKHVNVGASIMKQAIQNGRNNLDLWKSQIQIPLGAQALSLSYLYLSSGQVSQGEAMVLIFPEKL